MPAYKTHGISLKTSPFAEADKLVTLFTHDFGKIKVIAKSARRVPSSLGGRVEPFTYGEYLIAKCRSLDIISQCLVKETFQAVRENASQIYAGLYLLKLVDQGTAYGQPYPELFNLLLAALRRLKDGTDPRRTIKDFETGFVRIEGIYQEGVDPRHMLSEHLERDLSSW